MRIFLFTNTSKNKYFTKVLEVMFGFFLGGGVNIILGQDPKFLMWNKVASCPYVLSIIG